MTLHAVKQNIIEYGKKFADIGFSLGDSPRILVQQNHRVFGTEPDADFTDLQVKEICDITGTSDPAKGALIASPYEAMVVAKTEYTAMCIRDGLSIPAVLDDMAMIIGSRVSIVPEDRLSLAKALRKSPAVLTTEGNLMVCGRNLYEVFTGLLILEKNAGIFVDADFLGGAHPVCPLMGKLEHKIYLKKYSRKEMERQDRLEQQAPVEIPEDILQDAASDYAEMDLPKKDRSPEEQKCREQVVEYGIRLLDSGLVQGTWGNLSLRLDDEWMLCTPSGMDYRGLTPEDIVKVNLETLAYEGALKPTSEKDFHAGIYRNRPDVNAVIHTHARYACVYAACGLSFTTSSGDAIECAAYGPSGTGLLSRNVQNAIGENRGCLMKNHGMVAVGSDLDDAFHTAMSIENAAKARIEQFWTE